MFVKCCCVHVQCNNRLWAVENTVSYRELGGVKEMCIDMVDEEVVVLVLVLVRELMKNQGTVLVPCTLL